MSNDVIYLSDGDTLLLVVSKDCDLDKAKQVATPFHDLLNTNIIIAQEDVLKGITVIKQGEDNPFLSRRHKYEYRDLY